MNSSPFIDISAILFTFLNSHEKNKQDNQENNRIIEFYNEMEFCKATNPTLILQIKRPKWRLEKGHSCS